jgi:hypothetical protein
MKLVHPMKIITPKFAYPASLINSPLFFLAGPVQGGDDWQADCAFMLLDKLGDCHVAVPRSYSADHPLMPYIVSKMDGTFPRQLAWERNFLNLAGDPQWQKKGCILFWCPLESDMNPRPRLNGPYAQDTYGEIGEWRGRMMENETLRRVALGMADGFPGRDVIHRNYCAALTTDFPVYETLEETVDAAIKIATA